MRSQKVRKKAAKMGADTGDTAEVKARICAAVQTADEKNGAEMLGKALFDMTELARHIGVDAEQALFETCRAYIEQFGTSKE